MRGIRFLAGSCAKKVDKTLDLKGPGNIIVPRYAVLVAGGNILPSSFSMFVPLVGSLRWTMIIPLPVIMGLDGLAMSDSPRLSNVAKATLSFISSNHRILSTFLDVRMSKGNHLSLLNVPMEQVDFDEHRRSNPPGRHLA